MKKNLSFTGLLTFVSVVGYTLIFYPLIPIFSTAFATETDYSLLFTLLNPILGGIGYFFSQLIGKPLEHKNILLGIIKIILVILCFGILIFFTEPIIFLLCGLGTFCFAVGIFILKDSLSQMNIVFISAFNLGQILIFNILELDQDVSRSVWVYIAFCVMFLVYSNQSNINFLMERRSHKLEHLPSKIRIYNLGLISSVLAVILLIFGFKKQISAFFMWIFNAIHSFISYLFSFFEETEVDSTAETGESMDMSSMLEEGETYRFWEILSDIVTILAIFYLCKFIYSHRKEIWAWLVGIYKGICSFVVRMFQDTAIKDYFGQEDNDYKDTVEELAHEGIFQKLFKRKYSISAWRKEYRTFNSMKNSEEKFQYGYFLVIRWFKLYNIQIEDCQTPLEIFQKTEKVIHDQNWKCTTDDYNLFKYAEKEANLQHMESLCKILYSMK